MGVRGLYSFLWREKIPNSVEDHSIDNICNEISDYQKTHQKPLKLLFNIRAMNNYYEQTYNDVVFGCRFNRIKEDFESLLATLKNAGAELLFTSKKSFIDKDEQIKFDLFNEDYSSGMTFLKELETIELKTNFKTSRSYPWQEVSILVLAQSAQKFGTFHENDCFTEVFVQGHAKVANDEDVYAIFGLDTTYLFLPGSWKFFFPAKCPRTKKMIFKEYKKDVILKHFKFNYEQFQLFAVFGGKFYNTLENKKVLSQYFCSENHQDFHKIIKFVHDYAPRDKFPLQRATIIAMLQEIFKYRPIDDELIENFKNNLDFTAKLYKAENRFKDEEINLFLQKDPFSSLAECILIKFPFHILSPFLDVSATDMKSLMDLTMNLVARTSGVIINGLENEWKTTVVYRTSVGNLQKVEILAEFPSNTLKWKELIFGDASIDDKFKVLSFLIDDIISVENLKKVPYEYLMHVILTVHLVKNDSMTVTEAIAMTNSIKNSASNRIFIYPKKVNIRVFRVSTLYEKMYSVLLFCLSPLGLKEFIADLTLDNAKFQNNYNELIDWNPFKNANKEHVFDLMIAIINQN